MEDWKKQSLTRTTFSADRKSEEVAFDHDSEAIYRPGDLVGESYRLISQLGEGGMGVVYLAEHVIIGMRYALKLLAPRQINPANWQRFEIEGKALARLNHENIVRIYNMGIDRRGCPFYVMELLDGESLDDLRHLDTGTALDIYRQAASGLACAHASGIVHRDVKPSNIMVVEKGDEPQVKIVDFGIARLADKASQSLTGQGEIFGSPLYMSPEQCAGGAVDSRADIYSLGCSLFYTLTGKAPLMGATALETVMLHQECDAPALPAHYGVELGKVVARMLERSPEKRYQTMAQVEHDLARVKDGKSVGLTLTQHKTQKEVKGQDRKPLFLMALVAASVLFSVGILLYFLRPQEPLKHHKIKLMAASEENYDDRSADDVSYRGTRNALAHADKMQAETIERGGKKFLKLYFPREFSAGSLLSVPDNNLIRLQGTIEAPLGKPLLLEADSALDYYPRILDKLEPLTITEINISHEHEKPENILNQVKDWKEIERLSLYTSMKRKQLQVLDSMPQLITLNLPDPDINGQDLVGLACMRRLQRLEIKAMTGTNELLADLIPSKKLRCLQLEVCPMDEDGWKAICAMQSVTALGVRDDSVTNARVAALSGMKNLSVLALNGRGFDEHCVYSLIQCRKLTNLSIIGKPWSDEARFKFKKAMPNCILTFPYKKKSEDQI